MNASKMHKEEFLKNTLSSLSETVSESELQGKTILVALSGGADSTALLCSLCALSERIGFSVAACHVNHMIRGKEADRDESFSRALCERLGVPIFVHKADVPKIAKETKKGLEEAARDVRYGFFAAMQKDGKADFIATAHTASDNAETVLLNIARGCGISGICGIPKRRGNIIRPLLFAQRSDIEDYLSALGESYVTDSTNLEDDCTRNIIRHRIIPELKAINPSFEKNVSSLSLLAKRDNDYLEKTARESFTDDIRTLALMPLPIRARIIGNMYRKKSGNMLSLHHADMLCGETEKAFRENCGEAKLFDLPGGLCARMECGKLSIEDKNSASTYSDEDYEIFVEPGINKLCGGKFLAVYITNCEEKGKFCDKLEYDRNIYSLFMEAKLFSDIIKGKILLRSAKSGDKIRISGMSKDVRKLYSAKKIPLALRRILPRICDSATDEILALPYTGLCDSQHENYEKSDIILRLYQLHNEE